MRLPWVKQRLYGGRLTYRAPTPAANLLRKPETSVIMLCDVFRIVESAPIERVMRKFQRLESALEALIIVSPKSLVKGRESQRMPL